MQVNLIGIAGPFGSGKTLYATSLGINFLRNNPTKFLFTNYPLKNLGELEDRWEQYKFEDISKDILPENYKNGLMIIDEIQVGADAYDFLKDDVRNKMDFVNQIRKNDLELIVVAPNFDFFISRLRKLLTHFVILNPMVEEGIINARWFERILVSSTFEVRQFENPVIKDLSDYFKYYDTKYIVKKEPVKKKEEIKKVVNPKKKKESVNVEDE